MIILQSLSLYLLYYKSLGFIDDFPGQFVYLNDEIHYFLDIHNILEERIVELPLSACVK